MLTKTYTTKYTEFYVALHVTNQTLKEIAKLSSFSSSEAYDRLNSWYNGQKHYLQLNWNDRNMAISFSNTYYILDGYGEISLYVLLKFFLFFS